MERPHEIPHRVRFLKDARHRFLKDGDFAPAVGLHLFAIKFCVLVVSF